MPRETVTLRAQLGSGIEVDREAGVIRNVAVITAGTTKPSAGGGKPFDIDGVTLQQVADSINASEIGVKSRLTHPEIDGRDDITCRLGYIRNARVEGSVVRADMHFHNPGANEAITLMSIAETDPASAGLSIVDLDAQLEQANTATGIVLRVESIDAVDWVGEPAGNPAGMLSARHRITLEERGHTMLNEQQIEYLRGIGLDESATVEEAAAFYEGLTPEQKAAVDALAAVGEETTAEEPVEMEQAEEEEKPAMAAASTKPKAATGVSLSQADIDARIADSRKAERNRTKEIRNIALRCGYDDKWAEKHIDAETPIDEVRRVALASLKREPKDMQTTSVKVGADLNRDSLGQAVQDAILLRANCRQFVEFDGHTGLPVMLNAKTREPKTRQPHERANEFRGHTIIEMGRRFLMALGFDRADSMSKPELATLLMGRMKLQSQLGGVYLAHATGDFPYLLADSMGKVLRAEYALAPHTWSMWCARTTAPDYKSVKKLQLSEAADLIEIPEGDEYTFSSLTEGRETYTLAKYGNGLKFTREMLINDDLSAFDRAPRLLGRAAARLEESTAIGILTANASLADSNALFSTAHANLTTGTLSVSTLGAARALLRKQTALGSDDPLELTPRYLLVPETIATTAQQLVSSTVDPALANATVNPFANTLQVIPSARLDSDSTAQWYLLADPAEIDTVEMAFLEGEEAPVVEEEDEFDTDVRRLKVRHNLAAKAIDYRGMVRSSGS